MSSRLPAGSRDDISHAGVFVQGMTSELFLAQRECGSE